MSPAPRFGPSVRSQRLEVEAGSQVVAMALQPRLSDLNRRRLLPVIERVLRELDVPGRQVRIERLAVDLGTVPLSALDAELPRLLERELRRALREALHGGGEAGVRARPLARARAELLEHHLLRGTLPFWAPPGTSLASLVREMAAADPARLADVVRRLGTRAGVVERLVGQLDDRGLARLVRVLEPEHAALVLAYVVDLRRVHRREPLLPLSERRFGRHLWTLVQAYLVHDPGSEFNRRSFVGSLLRGMSRGHGLSYAALLATLARGLALTRRRRPVASSLPAVVGELLREERVPVPPGSAERDPPGAKGRRRTARDADLAPTPAPHDPSPEGAWPIGSEADAVQARPGRSPSSADERGRIGSEARAPREPADRDASPDDARRSGSEADAVQASSGRSPPSAGEREGTGSEARTPRESADRHASLDGAQRIGRGADAAQTPSDRSPSSAGDRGRIGSDARAPRESADRDSSPDDAWRSGSEADAAQAPSERDASSLVERGRIGSDADAAQAPADRDSSSVDGRRRGMGSDARVSRERSGRDASSDDVRRSGSEAEAAAGSEDHPAVGGGSAGEAERAGEVADGRASAKAGWQRAGEDGAGGDPADRATSAGEGRARAGRGVGRDADAGEGSGRRIPHTAEPPVAARYDLAEAAGYLLRHGVLPWGARLRDPALDAAGLLSALPELPVPLLHAALRAAGAGARRRRAAVLARGLSDGDLARLLACVLPAAAGGPFRDALAAFADNAADRRLFLACVVGAAVDGDPLDLEALAAAAGEPEPRRPAELAAWPAHLLQSVLADALRAGAAPAPGAPAPAAVLAALADAHPADARHYLRALAARPPLAEALARAAAPLHERVLELLDPAGAPTARALAGALAALPAPLRPAAPDALRRAVLLEAMRLREGESPGEAFFARVLAALFGARVPEAAGDRLLAAADAWARPGGLPAAHVAAFRAALTAALARSAPGAAATPDARPSTPAAAPPPPAAPPEGREAPGSGEEARRAVYEAVFAFLLGRRPTGAAAALSAGTLRHLLERMADEAPGALAAFLRRHAARRRLRERWARVLPEGTLARLARVLAPRRHRALLDAAEVLHAAWRDAIPPGHAGAGGRAAFWGFFLRFAARGAGAGATLERLAEAFFADRAAGCAGLVAAADLPALGARLLEQAERAAVARGHASLRAALHRRRRRLLAAWGPPAALPRLPAGRPAPRPRPARRPSAFALEADAGGGEPVYVANAGLVLAAPFLPRLFTTLELLAEDEDGRRALRDAEAVSRAVHLLQYLVDGSTATPEPALALNKVLCGVPLATPVDASADLDARERAACDLLLASLLAGWTALSGTSVAGLRETFLQREGRLNAVDGGWRLTVQRKTLDVLVDELPWTLSVVLHDWMPGPLHVTW